LQIIVGFCKEIVSIAMALPVPQKMKEDMENRLENEIKEK
jgi:hypothetical protein